MISIRKEALYKLLLFITPWRSKSSKEINWKRRRLGRIIINMEVLILWLVVIFCIIFLIYLYRARLLRERILEALGPNRNTEEMIKLNDVTTILDPSHGCQFKGKNALAVVMVTSLPGQRKQRDLIRRTWAARKYQTTIMVFFFIGRPSCEQELERLYQEAFRYGDLIVEDLEEHYYGLGVKTLRMLKWFSRNCNRSQFLIKTDDDVFINLPYFNRILPNLTQDFQIGGKVLRERTPNFWNPFTKYYTPRDLWIDGMAYPTYLGGPCYVIRGEIVPKILSSSLEIPLYHFEDVLITGMIASQKLGLELKEFPGTLDPKFPLFWYVSWMLFGGEEFSSFHTDGGRELLLKLYRGLV